jgi:SAM-dependent methyltransferase
VKALLRRLLPEGLRRNSRRWRGAAIARLASGTNLVREPLSHLFLRGEGIEIGSLNWPLDVPSTARVTYVDAWPTEFLAQRHPEFASTLLPVGIVAPIETLAGVADASQDFVIANHVLEHSENPVAAMRNMVRVLRTGGILFLTLPDKRYTFDVDRPVTSFAHLLEDEREGSERSRLIHYRDWAQNVDHVSEAELDAAVARMDAERPDIHFHVWTQADMLDLLVRLRHEAGLPLDLEAMSKTGIESIFVLRKMES